MLAVNVPYTDCGHKAPRQVVEHHDGRHRGEHAPIAIAGQQCQRTEDVKMGFDPTAREVDQDRGSEPLGDGHRVPRHRATGAQDCHQDRRPDDRAAQENGRPNVRVNPARLARPRSGRHHDRRRDLAGPLQHQQPGKQPVHPTALAKSLRGEQLFLPALDSWNDAAEGALDLAHGKIPTVLPILERCRSRATAGCSRGATPRLQHMQADAPELQNRPAAATGTYKNIRCRPEFAAALESANRQKDLADGEDFSQRAHEPAGIRVVTPSTGNQCSPVAANSRGG